MEITTEQIKELRNATGVSVMQCKKALEEAEGDMAKAKVILQKLSARAAEKKADRELGAGTVASYIHNGGAVGAMVELSCETDFVSKNEEYKNLARDIAMQVAAMAPSCITRDSISQEEIAKAKEVFAKDLEGKPADMHEKILEGKLDNYLKEKVLVEQVFIKDDSKKIADLLSEGTQKFGEKIEITNISRFSVQ